MWLTAWRIPASLPKGASWLFLLLLHIPHSAPLKTPRKVRWVVTILWRAGVECERNGKPCYCQNMFDSLCSSCLFLGDVNNSFLITAFLESVALMHERYSLVYWEQHRLVRASLIGAGLFSFTILVSLYVKNEAKGFSLTIPLRSCS